LRLISCYFVLEFKISLNNLIKQIIYKKYYFIKSFGYPS
jgi:hypothetical protein